MKAKAIFPKNTIQFNGQKISFTNGGVSRGKQIIDSNNRQVSTYFGNNFSPSDHAFTHFIAHNPGAGQNFMSLKNNNSVVCLLTLAITFLHLIMLLPISLPTILALVKTL